MSASRCLKNGSKTRFVKEFQRQNSSQYFFHFKLMQWKKNYKNSFADPTAKLLH
jgi:hypothetical protein